MITADQIHELALKFNINDTVIFREYIQLAFLQKLYQETASQNIYFKGGTAIHIIYHAPRFSEDLDFTVDLPQPEFKRCMEKVLKRMQEEEIVHWKEKQSIAVKTILLTAEPGILPYRTFVNLDFSFREKALSPKRSIIQTEYPIIFTSYAYHLSAEEILAEKILAIMTRRKGRDLYDLWYLLSKGVSANNDLVRKKIAYYKLDKVTNEDIRNKIASFPEKEFILDLRPFVPQRERERLGSFLLYLKDQVNQSLR